LLLSPTSNCPYLNNSGKRKQNYSKILWFVK